jgi:signal transduction histidine kinase
MKVENMIADDVRFEADQDLLRIVYCNLISNACNYGKEHGIIRLTAIDKGDRYRMAVWNDGVGISEDKIPLLFEKFSRIQQNAPMNVKGTGLGLFICRDIIERHGGKIWAESSYGNWISFIIEIPKYLKGE